ncbi:MAG TPA: hypothetical protein VMF66_00925 [Candidatus Acidoferrum sp.]|nr:hypothetical protein [Candidatus Acidoferrum sp.]
MTFKTVTIASAVVTIVAAFILCFRAAGQVLATGSGTVHTPWGYYIWQADYGGATTAFLSETGISKSAGTVQIPVTIPAAVTIGEVHGDVSFAVWKGSGCSNGSAVAQVRDQDGDVLASVNLTGRSPSSTTVPISTTFASARHISALQLQTSTAQCSALTVSWSLVMS